jgi:putative DNA primase/helicase
VVETLKLIIPQQDTPARRLIGFQRRARRKAGHSARTTNHTGCAPCAMSISPAGGGETLETHAPHFWRWLDRAVQNPQKRDVILAALFMVLANRYDWQLFLEVTGPGAAGKVFWPKSPRCSPGRITPRRPPSKRWNHPAKRSPDWLLAHPSA